MAILLTITENPTQILSGIPRDVTVEADQPCSIFYTLDGSEPTTDSDIFIEPVVLPTDLASVTIRFYATNILDTSEIISRTYSTNLIPVRGARDTVGGSYPDALARQGTFPYSSPGPNLPVEYLGPSELGIVDSPSVPNTILDGYNADGYALYNIDASPTDYPIVYTTTDNRGISGPGIGNLPHKTTIRSVSKREERAQTNLFNPKAAVLIFDNTKPMPPNFIQLNREHFSLFDPESYNYGNLFHTTGEEGNRPTTSFIRSFWNPTNNTIHYYHFDSVTNKWLISIEPYNRQVPVNQSLSSSMVSPSKVFRWIPFMWRAFPH